ncbi:hypothetical protein [Dysgonomonas alginatilytica]|uniref:hypothetical protein n=1 Tax=Dysgonomonas alginatilytica TaxID=1605892 RepID=UPI0011B4E6E4|nr:hypothetical protein [Dysgonomonas alginatilytica]
MEKEIIELSSHVHFDDNQISIYSVEIAELLIRCVVEIEAISKDLYFINGGTKSNDKDLFFDTDCLDLLEQRWMLSKKVVIVSAANFYFQSQDNKIFTPLRKANKRGTSSADWTKAYQAVKHNRSVNLSKANIKHLLRGMGALFILNLYFKNEIFNLSNNSTDNFSGNLSELFDIKVHPFCGETYGDGDETYSKHQDFDECVYLIKWTNDFRNKHKDWADLQNKKLNELIFNHPKVAQYIQNNLMENGLIKEKEFLSFVQERKQFDFIDMNNEYPRMIQKAASEASEILKFDYTKNRPMYEAILNKCQKIYSF